MVASEPAHTPKDRLKRSHNRLRKAVAAIHEQAAADAGQAYAPYESPPAAETAAGTPRPAADNHKGRQ